MKKAAVTMLSLLVVGALVALGVFLFLAPWKKRISKLHPGALAVHWYPAPPGQERNACHADAESLEGTGETVRSLTGWAGAQGTPRLAGAVNRLSAAPGGRGKPQLCGPDPWARPRGGPAAWRREAEAAGADGLDRGIPGMPPPNETEEVSVRPVQGLF
ncbi:hypothetical protein NDU88_007629 [Pleurodeles waltl]|uniref:Uncharacterized protein n=1 Tax=Pleurodeles waltl TaxID=8319 RepID=A0AAV7QPN8_PLEWA|nr:hypothetical protein NDU88_007629 [Pleurodeles waltl]